MTLSEIARRLGKARWADQTEYTEAWNAYQRLSPDKQTEVARLVETRYGTPLFGREPIRQPKKD